MKMLLLNVYDNFTKVVDASKLEDYYELIGCTCIDIVNRKIGRKRFDIICDDEGTFRSDAKISAIDNLGQIMLVGNLLITGSADIEGNLTELTDKDIKYIRDRIQNISTRIHLDGYNMLTQCGY